jgi:hypothetical protein
MKIALLIAALIFSHTIVAYIAYHEGKLDCWFENYPFQRGADRGIK